MPWPRAEHFDSLAGVSLGKLVRIHEVGGPLPAGQDLAETGYGQQTTGSSGRRELPALSPVPRARPGADMLSAPPRAPA